MNTDQFTDSAGCRSPGVCRSLDRCYIATNYCGDQASADTWGGLPALSSECSIFPEDTCQKRTRWSKCPLTTI